MPNATLSFKAMASPRAPVNGSAADWPAARAQRKRPASAERGPAELVKPLERLVLTGKGRVAGSRVRGMPGRVPAAPFCCPGAWVALLPPGSQPVSAASWG